MSECDATYTSKLTEQHVLETVKQNKLIIKPHGDCWLCILDYYMWWLLSIATCKTMPPAIYFHFDFKKTDVKDMAQSFGISIHNGWTLDKVEQD